MMTPSPESVTPDITVLEALQVMHDNKFLTLPVCEDSGLVIGVVDVMDCIYGCGGVEGWRSVFNSALDLDDLSESGSRVSRRLNVPSVSPSRSAKVIAPSVAARGNQNPATSQKLVDGDPVVMVAPDTAFMTSIPNNIPRTLEFTEGHADFEEGNMSRMESRFDGSVSGISETHNMVVFKIVDLSGNTHRIRSEARLGSLLEAFTDKLNYRSAKFKFVDDEGDAIVISSDADLAEAVHLAHRSGNKVVKLSASECVDANSGGMDPMTLAAVGVAVAAVGVIAMVTFRPKR